MLCMDIQYTHLLHREDQARLSFCEASRPSIVLSGKPGDEATRAIAGHGAQAEVAGARAPVCPSLATPLEQDSFG